MRRHVMWVGGLLVAMALVGCGSATGSSSRAASNSVAGPSDAAAPVVAEASAADARQSSAAGGTAGKVTSNGVNQPAGKTVAQITTIGNDGSRKIIKNGDLTLQVENVTIGINRITTVAAQQGGYVLEVKSSDQGGDVSTATVAFAVPVDHFEAALQGVRESGKHVASEQVSGRDVSEEYVDLQSQITNLEETESRVRKFLDQAKNVDEALKVNAQLSDLQGQISRLKGQLQYLGQRAAYSTITVQLRLDAAPLTSGTPAKWQPGTIAREAAVMLERVLQGLATVAIWFGIVVVPLALPVLLALVWLRNSRLRGQHIAQSVAVPDTTKPQP